MDIKKIEDLILKMAPEEAASFLSGILKKVFPLLEEETRLTVISNLVGDASNEKVSSLVHL